MSKKLKDYLNTKETIDMAVIGKLMDMLDEFIKNWEGRGNLSPEERKGFKMSLTWGEKAWQKVMKRMSKKGISAYENKQENYAVYVYDKFAFENMLRKIDEAKKELMIKREPHYYDLCELVIANNCLDCSKCQGDCDYAKEFIKNNVEEPFMEPDYEWKHCKYAYCLEDIKGLKNESKGKKVV